MTPPPKGWTRTTLGEVGTYLNGRAFKKSEWADTGRPIIRIQNLTGSSAAFNYFQGDLEDRYVAHPGDLLVSWAATLGAYIWTGPEAVVNQHIFKVRSRLDQKFHKYLLDYKLTELMTHTHGSGMVHITRSKFDAVPVDVPSRREQQHVVEVLEDHLSRLDAEGRYLQQVVKRVDAWAASMADELIWSPGWSTRELGSLLREPMRNGRSDRAVRDGSAGVRTLTLTAVTRNEFTDVNTKLTTTSPEVARGLWLEPGDIFVQRSNTPDLVGTAARFEGRRDWAIFPDLLIRVRPDEDVISSAFMCAVLRSERAHRSLRARAKGLAGSMPKIDQAAIAAVQVPIPTAPQQLSIVDKLAEVESARSSLLTTVRVQQRRAVGLRLGVLAAAFSGMLSGGRSDTEAIEEFGE